MESAPIAEYQEWPFQGFLKRMRIVDDTTYNLEFKLPDISKCLDPPIDSEVLGVGSSKEMSARLQSLTKLSYISRCIQHGYSLKRKARPMDARRSDGMQDEGGWLLVERDPYCPPPPESRDDLSALFYETERVVSVEVTVPVAQQTYRPGPYQ